MCDDEDWNASETLAKYQGLAVGMTKSQVEAITGAPCFSTMTDGEFVVADYVEDFDNFIGRHCVTGGPFSFSGITVVYASGKVVEAKLNPCYVDQDRLDAYSSEFPLDKQRKGSGIYFQVPAFSN